MDEIEQSLKPMRFTKRTRSFVTSEEDAAAALAMKGVGIKTSAISQKLAISVQTLNDIFQGRGRWGGLKDFDPKFKDFRDDIKRIMQVKALSYADLALDKVGDAIPKNSRDAYQASLVFKTLRDSERLDAGEATSHIAHLHKYEIDALEGLAQRLEDINTEETKDEKDEHTAGENQSSSEEFHSK